MASVRLERVGKVYANGHVAVREISLETGDGELVVLVGPSGCGKSTTLRMIAGLEVVSTGNVFIGERRVNDVPPAERDVAMVFQNYALYPHMTVRENLSFGLKLRKVEKAEIAKRVGAAADTLGLTAVLDRRPAELSGGQRQRVAVGRAIVREPEVFLFDEPLSNLDARLREQTRKEIARLHQRIGATMIYVTHDQVEAMTLGDRIVVMEGGIVQQIDSPLGLYERPVNRFVAGFIGSPAMNFVEGAIVRDGRPTFRSTDGGLVLAIDGARGAPAPRDGVTLGVRPEHLRLAGPTDGEGNVIEATLDVIETMGNETVVHATRGPDEIVARLDPGSLPGIGTTIRLAPDPARLHFFDTSAGNALA